MRQIDTSYHEKKYRVGLTNIAGGFLILIALLVFLAANVVLQPEAKAQETEESGDYTPEPLESGKTYLSLTKVAPFLTPVSDYRGDFLHRSTMFGDVGGERQKIYEDGITFNVQLTQVFQWVASGGPRNLLSGKTKKNATSYNGLLEYGLTLDTGKAKMWPGGLFVVNAYTGFADDLPLQSGNVSLPNFTSILPEPTPNRTFLQEYYFMQAFSERVSMVVGRVNVTNFLDKNRFANDPRNQFLNISMVNDPLYGAFISFSTYGLLVPIVITDYLTISPAVYDPNIQPGQWFKPGDGVGFFDDVGVAAEADLSWKLRQNLGGALRVVGIYVTKDALATDNPRLPVQLIEGIEPDTKSGNWIIGLNAEQYLWKPSSAAQKKSNVRTASFDFQEPGIGLFGRFGYTPADRNLWNIYASGGVGGRGFVPSRPYDRMGLGAYWLKESKDLDFLPVSALKNELGLEAFYNIALTPWLQLSVDFQWINTAVVKNENPIVLGTRLFTIF